jgi:protein involved in polysaccharide export with SLBB domain
MEKTVIRITRTRQIFGCLFAMLTASVAAQHLLLAQGPQPSTPVLKLQTEKNQVYRLRPGDAIDVRFFFNPELNEQIQVRPDGRISLQLVGEIEVVNHSIEEAVGKIEALAAKELRTPRVSIQVRSYAEQKVYVTGEVYRPGLIPLLGDVSVTTAISEAGGIKNTGNRKTVILIRKGEDGAPIKYKLQLEEDGKPTEQALAVLRPSDVIIVPETRIANMGRWVDQYVRALNPVNLAFGFTYLKTLQAQSPAQPQMFFPF